MSNHSFKVSNVSIRGANALNNYGAAGAGWLRTDPASGLDQTSFFHPDAGTPNNINIIAANLFLDIRILLRTTLRNFTS